MIGSYFFKNGDGHNIAINGERYKAVISAFFVLFSEDIDVKDPWIQQDGATCQRNTQLIEVIERLWRGFDDRAI